MERHDLTAESISDKYSAGPSIRPICTRCCSTITYMIHVCSNFYISCVVILTGWQDEIALLEETLLDPEQRERERVGAIEAH